MKNQTPNSQKDAKLNQFLSAFLVIAYVICTYFIASWVATITNATLQNLATALLYIVFGLLLFYATRVGEGKQIKRFSLSVLLLMVVPGLYILLAILAPGMPLNAQIISSTPLRILGFVMLGYGIPYTFISGYERVAPEAEEEIDTFRMGEEEEADWDEEAGEAGYESEEELEENDDPAEPGEEDAVPADAEEDQKD